MCKKSKTKLRDKQAKMLRPINNMWHVVCFNACVCVCVTKRENAFG